MPGAVHSSPELRPPERHASGALRRAPFAADAEGGADFVDLYAHTGSNTACDGANRGIGGLLEDSQVELLGSKLPWYGHLNEKGRDVQAKQVADKIEQILNR